MANYLNINVAVGVIVDQHDRVLISKRLQGKHLAGFWEFPGGKVEAGENGEQALIRELHEELGIVVKSCEPLLVITHQYLEKTVCLDVRRVTAFSGEPFGKEQQEVRWVSKSDLGDYQFPEANQQILTAL